jgi:hypothetical protein
VLIGIFHRRRAPSHKSLLWTRTPRQQASRQRNCSLQLYLSKFTLS